MSEISLELRGLTKQFGGLTAVNCVTIKTMRRTVHALIGPNGSGKTTTINLIHGVFKPTSGAIYYNGQEISKLKTHQIAKMNVGRTYQNIKLFSSMTVLENMLVGGDKQFGESGLVNFLLSPGKYKALEKDVIEYAGETLHALGLYALKDEVVSNLAYGRQKAVELGRTLMGRPSLILLDEPAAGLNPTERREFVDILEKTFEAGIDLFLIEHNMDVVMNISHNISVLNFGSLIAQGKPREIQYDENVIKAYLGEKYRAI